MKKIMFLFFVLIPILLTACATIHPVRLVDIREGQILKGQYDERDHSVQVIMPNGEILTGYYSLNRSSSMAFGHASRFDTIYSNSNRVNTVGNDSWVINTVSNNGQAYAILKGNQGTVMEILVNFSGTTGFGQAVTNKGKRYGVQF